MLCTVGCPCFGAILCALEGVQGGGGGRQVDFS